MSDGVGFKKGGTIRLLGGVAAIALVSWGVWSFCCGARSTSAQRAEYAFGGWIYDREDQRSAGAALAAAGLNDYRWEDGKLSVPLNKKGEYQTALAAAGAYPKAPSESRRDAIREMSAFESETKTRMRELDACAFQLERTIERLSGVEYATVGVRARREQVGLVAKNVVTASVGVACKEGAALDLDAISAITVATKHQLGVESDENVSIIDLKEGKSYFGTEKSVGNASSLAYFNEKERVEKYWRLKFQETFDYIKNARISVAVELAAATRDAKNSAPNASANGASVASVRGATRRPAPLASAEDVRPRAAASPRRSKSVKLASSSANDSTAFAKLGNPSVARPVAAQNLAAASVETVANVSSGRILPASFSETPELADFANLPQDDAQDAAPPTKTTSDGRGIARQDSTSAAALADDGCETAFEVRSLAVRVGIPRGYVRRVAQSLASESANPSDGASPNAEIYRSTEQNIVDETKRVALKMLRPIQERNGWDETETASWIDVSVFSDVDGANGPKTTFQRVDGVAANADESAENWRVYGNFADVSEKVAEKSEGEAAPSERATFDVAAIWKKIDFRSPFFLGAFGLIVAALAAGAVWAVARRKNRKNAAARRPGSSAPERAATVQTSAPRKVDDFADFADDLDDDLKIASLIERARTKKNSPATGALYSAKRREASDFVARDPDRAASALNRWVKPNVYTADR